MLGVFVAFLCPFLSLGDTLSIPPPDTLRLEQVDVYVQPLDRFAKGQQIKVYGRQELEMFQGRSLADFLQAKSGLFVRQYGPGMIASLSMRGTSAGHNAVFWNGVPINSPSLGQADFSILPVSGMDQVQVHLGSSGALYGTDAIGGAVHLNSRLAFGLGFQTEANLGLGSFGMDRQEITVGFSDKKFASRTKVYRQLSQNRYPYRNRAKIGTPVEIQEHAQVRQGGALQDIAWNASPNTQISSSFWWHYADREIQPVMGSNTSDVQTDQSMRWAMDVHHFKGDKTWNLKLGWVHDEMIYNISTENVTDQYFLSGELDWQITPSWGSKTGARVTYVQGLLSTYTQDDQRLELYQSFNFSPFEDFVLAMNLRQMAYQGNFAPFTPSLGVDWKIFQKAKRTLTWKAAASRSFKVPTLNDRYWVPGGNPDLDSETAVSAESGLAYLWTHDGWVFETSLTAFKMLVDNWIIWLPQESFWSPRNIQKVESRGLEFFLNLKKNIAEWELGISTASSWNRAVILEDGQASSSNTGNQLPYTPVYKSQVTTDVKKGRFGGFVNAHQVGERYISTGNQTLMDGYHLWDVGTNYTWKLKHFRGSLGLQVNNVFDTTYEILRLRPMPGRNYQLNLMLSK